MSRERVEDGELPGLDPADVYKIDAAEGYHMMGELREAARELESIPEERRDHQLFLHIACRVYGALGRMPEAMDYTERFLRVAPQHPFGYMYMSMLLIFLKRPRESYDLLVSAVPLFPDHETMHWTIASSAARCGLWMEAKHWVYLAICINPSYKQTALSTPELAPIRMEIEAMNPGN